MNWKHLFFGFIITSCAHFSYSQTLTSINSEDNSAIAFRLKVVFPNKEIHVDFKKNEAINWTLFGGFEIAEITAKGHEVKIISSTSIPTKIYLKKHFQAVEEVVVTGQLRPGTVTNAIQNVRVINAEMIEQRGAQNLTNLLKNELNIQIQNDLVLGAGLTLQGLGGENVKILVDGVPVIGRLNGSVDLTQINLGNVEKIEIIEGPLSVNYGSDALAGTINIITKSQSPNKVNLEARSYYESNGTYNNLFKTSFNLKKTFVSIDVNRNYFDGWKPTEENFHIEKERLADTSRTKLFKPREQFFGSLKLVHTLSKKQRSNPLKLSYNLQLFDEELMSRGMPTKPYFNRATDAYFSTQRIDNNLQLTGQLSNRWFTNILAGFQDFQRISSNYIVDLTNMERQLVKDASMQDTSRFQLFLSRASFSYDPAKRYKLEVGYDINHETTVGRKILNSSQYMTDVALFATSELSISKRFLVKPGVRYAYNSTFKAPLIPSLFLKYDLKGNHQIRASYSRGFRAPSLKELYFYFVDINHNIQGNEALVAENSDNYQLSYTNKIRVKSTVLSYTVSTYFNSLNNLITLAQINPIEFGYVNILKSQSFGFNLNGRITSGDFSLDFGGLIAGNSNQVSLDNNRLYTSYYPEFRINPSFNLKKLNSTINAFCKYTGELPNFSLNENSEVFVTKRDAFFMVDFTATTHFWKKKIQLAYGVKNAMDIKTINGNTSEAVHSQGSSIVQIGMGRTYFMSILMNLNSKK
jgi:outer membrane receptor for ferrienterochelin and colicins